MQSNRPPPARGTHLPIALILIVVCLALAVAGGVLAWLAYQFTLLPPVVAAALRITVFVSPLIAASVGLTIVWRRYGWRESIAAHYHTQAIRARTQVAPLATSFNYRIDQTAAAEAEPLLLGPGAPDVGPLPPDRWLAWADDQPHILLGGRTKAGKTTTATAFLARRLAARETVFIVDPHSSGWLGLPTAGRISRPGELAAALHAVVSEYQARMAEREAYKARTGQELPHNHFGRLTVLVDECNEIAEKLPVPWVAFTKELASGGRKVGISLLCLAQSPLVEDLKISGGMRSNFAALALDTKTVQDMIDRCRDRERRDALNSTLIGLPYPATAQLDDALIYLLDRSGLEGLRAPADAVTLVWRGWDFEAGAAIGQVAPAPEQTLIAAPENGMPQAIGEVRLSWVIAHMMRRGLPYTEIAAIVASFIARAVPETDRAAAQAEVMQRAARFAANNAIDALAEQLDRAALVRACVAVGGGVNLAVAIYGGKRQAFYDLARAAGAVGNREHGERGGPNVA